MATTTNYGWTTPDDTALVKDGASAIRSLGTAVDTTTKNLNPETTLGDIAYRSSTANTNTRLAIGSTGQVLTVAGGVPSWATPAGGGKVLQVISATTTTATTIASTTFTDSGLSASITPSATSSKILILWTQQVYQQRNSPTTSLGIGYQILRGATAIYKPAGSGFDADYLELSSGNYKRRLILAGSYLDSPSTTSSTTYKTQGRVQVTDDSGSMTFQENTTNSVGSIILMEIGA